VSPCKSFSFHDKYYRLKYRKKVTPSKTGPEVEIVEFKQALFKVSLIVACTDLTTEF